MTRNDSAWERLTSGISVLLLFGAAVVVEKGGDFRWLGYALAVLAMVATGAMLYKTEKEVDRGLLPSKLPEPSTKASVKAIMEALSDESLLRYWSFDRTSRDRDIYKKLWHEPARLEQILLVLKVEQRRVLISMSEKGHMSVTVEATSTSPSWEEYETPAEKPRVTLPDHGYCYSS